MKPTIVLLIIGLGAGVLFSAQLKTPRQRILNPVEPFSSLTTTRDNLVAKAASLKDEIKKKRDQNSSLQSGLSKNKKNAQILVDELKNLKETVGLTDVQSKGLVVTLADARSGEATIDSIVHAADLRDIINIMWSAGASAISINDERIVAITSIDSIVNTVLVNNTRLTSPFVIKAVGDSKILGEAIDSQDNLSDIHRRKKNFGLIINVERAKEVSIPAFSGSFDIKFAQIKP